MSLFDDVMLAIDSVSTLAKLDVELERYFLVQGVSHFAFTFYNRVLSSRYRLKHTYASKEYKRWSCYYHSEAYLDVDSTLREVYESCSPVLWNVRDQLAQAQTKKERQMRQDSLDYGAKQGVCIPLHGAYFDFATLVLVECDQQSFMSRWENEHMFWCSVSQAYFNRLRQLIQPVVHDPIAGLLNQQQMNCLRYTARSFSVRQIASQMGLAERTVNYHIQKANKILGTKNKHQSVAKLRLMKVL